MRDNRLRWFEYITRRTILKEVRVAMQMDINGKKRKRTGYKT